MKNYHRASSGIVSSTSLHFYQLFINHWGALGGRPYDHFSDEPMRLGEGRSDSSNTRALRS